jgi:hypothetical protein
MIRAVLSEHLQPEGANKGGPPIGAEFEVSALGFLDCLPNASSYRLLPNRAFQLQQNPPAGCNTVHWVVEQRSGTLIEP